MTLAEARLYQAAHRYAATDPSNPNLSPEVRAELQDPRIQTALRSGQSTTVRVGDTDYRLENGRVVSMEQGGHSALSPLVWAAKHPKTTIALMAAPVVAPYAVQALTGGGGAAGAGEAGAGTGVASGAAPAATAPITAGAAGTTGATGALGADVATEAAAGMSGGTAGTGASSWLGGVGKFLGSTAGGAVIGTAGNLIGAGIQSRGISKAAEIQAQTAREALAYAKQRDQYLQNLEAQRYGQFNARMQPYMNLGQSAGARMAQILGLDPSQFAPAQTWPGVTGSETGAVQPDIRQRGPATPGGPAEGTAVPRPASVGQMITMRAPDGSTKAVPQEHVSFYQQAGAQVVG